MNGVRTTFLRRGYLLTALAAAVLLAASPGTALAQVTPGTASIQLDRSSTEFTEGAVTTANPAGVIKVTRTGNSAGLGTTTQDVTLLIGSANPASDGGTLTIDEQGPGGSYDNGTVSFSAGSAEVTLVISQNTDEDWADNTYSLVLQQPTNADIKLGTSRATVTAKDANPAPVAAFSKSSIKLVEDSSTKVSVSVGNARGERRPVAASLTDVDQALLVVVNPPGILDDDNFATGASNTDTGAIAITTGATPAPLTPVAGKPGQYTLQIIGDFLNAEDPPAATPLELTITAAADMSGYKDSMITVSFEPKSLKPDEGAITDGGSLSIHVESDEEIPVVSFVPTSLTLDEGGDATLAILAEGKFGAEVGEADVMVSGDARIMLSGDNVTAGDDVDDYGNGTYTVDLGTSANTKVTVMAKGDESLADGETAMGMLKLVSADDAMIGGDNAVSVTVRGSTSVPALPLLAQLLLALFLMAGGSRLYRRRRG